MGEEKSLSFPLDPPVDMGGGWSAVAFEAASLGGAIVYVTCHHAYGSHFSSGFDLGKMMFLNRPPFAAEYRTGGAMELTSTIGGRLRAHEASTRPTCLACGTVRNITEATPFALAVNGKMLAYGHACNMECARKVIRRCLEEASPK